MIKLTPHHNGNQAFINRVIKSRTRKWEALKTKKKQRKINKGKG